MPLVRLPWGRTDTFSFGCPIHPGATVQLELRGRHKKPRHSSVASNTTCHLARRLPSETADLLLPAEEGTIPLLPDLGKETDRRRRRIGHKMEPVQPGAWRCCGGHFDGRRVLEEVSRELVGRIAEVSRVRDSAPLDMQGVDHGRQANAPGKAVINRENLVYWDVADIESSDARA